MDGAIQTAIIKGISSVLITLLAAIAAYGVRFIRQHVSEKNITAGVGIAKIAVHAAEQIGATNDLGPRTKFNDALNRARNLAKTAGINFSDADWQTLIERAVAELNGAYGSLLAPIAAPAFVTSASDGTLAHDHPLAPGTFSATGGPITPIAPTAAPEPEPAPPEPEPEPEPTVALFYTSGPNAGLPVPAS